MGRYFEWLFPILGYLRRWREVSAWRAWGTVVVIVLLPALVDFGWRAMPLALTGQFFAEALWLLEERIESWAWITFYTGLVLSIFNVVELGVALLFVRHRPGRRRPLCTRQTIKCVALGSQTWAILVLATIGIYIVMAFYADLSMPESEHATLWIMTGITAAVMTTLLVTLGATAVQAALAVIALQDDRRCEQCGYFLIGLTVPRCPECGTPFDASKLAGLAQAADVERESP